MMIMETLIDENIKKYYSFAEDNFCKFKPHTLKQDLDVLRKVYGNLLISILGRMLAENPAERPSPAQVVDFI